MATVNDLIKKAQSQIGVKEYPTNSNKVKYNTEYYGKAVSGSDYPWCCVFMWWIFKECGASDLFCGGKKIAYCPTVENYYKGQGRYYKTGQVGDLVLFDFGKGRASHIGIVEKVNSDGTYTTIEGNTGNVSQDNGGAVMRKVRSKTYIRGFARPNYIKMQETQTTTSQTKGGNTVNITLNILKKGCTGKNVKALQILLNGKGFACGAVDGSFGSGTDSAVRKYQKAMGLAVDGSVGNNTWTSLLA